MKVPPIDHVRSDTAPLTDTPINPEWIISGTPTARSTQWWASDDGLWTYYVWECTAGSFRWQYWTDESVHVAEGGFRCRIDDDDEWLEVKAGDSLIFKGGTHVTWEIPEYVRKHASLRALAPPLSKRVLLKGSRVARRAASHPAPRVTLGAMAAATVVGVALSVF